MRFPILLGGLALIAAPMPAMAQDEDLSAVSDALRDPGMQAQASALITALSQVLLDVPVGPLAEAVEEASGQDLGDVRADDTVRDLAPEAEVLPELIESELPRAMDRLAGMTGALQTMLPALRDMARKFEQVIEESAIPDR